MADTSAKPGLTDRQLEDAIALLEDDMGKSGMRNIEKPKGASLNGGPALAIEGVKNDIHTTYKIDSLGNIEVSKKYIYDDTTVATRIPPNGKIPVSEKGKTIRNTDSGFLDEKKIGALRAGSIQDAQKAHSHEVLNLGPANEFRTVEDMGKSIDERARVRFPEKYDNERMGNEVVHGIMREEASRPEANALAETFERYASGKTTVEETNGIMAVMQSEGITDPEKFKTAAKDYADRLRGAEGSKLVGELRESAQAKEGAKLLSGLLERSPSFGKEAAALGKETKVATEALEHSGAVVKIFSKAAKVLPVVGTAVAISANAAEASEKNAIAQDAVEHGQMSPEALTEYRGIQAAQMATVVDPTVIGGEMAVQKGYKAFAEANNLSPELAESLRPSALTDVVPEVKQLSPADLSAEQNKFDRIYDGVSNIKPEDLPPENRPALEALQENKSLITATEQKLDGKAGQLGADGFDRGKELANLDKYQQQYKEVYDDLDQSGQLDGIDNHIAAQKEQKAPAATADTAIAATQEKTPPIAANDEEYGQSPSQTAARPPASRPAASAPAPT